MVTSFKHKKKSNMGKRVLLYVGAALLLLIVAILVVANIRIYQKRQEFFAQVENLKNQIKDLQNRNSNLQQGISKSSDSQYIEKVAREQLDLQKPGEKEVSFVVSQPDRQNSNNSNQNVVNYWFGWIGNSWNWLVGKK